MPTIGPPQESQLPDPQIIPTGASRKAIDAAASRISSKLGYEPGSDLRNFIEEKLGGCIAVAEPEERIEYGYLRVPGKNGHPFDIVLSPYTGEFHDRFTMAHELGHYFLHYKFQDRKEPLVVRREGTNRAESEANWFAEAFLMPAEEFEKEMKESDGYLPSLIYRFRVASDLIHHRSRILKTLNSPKEDDGVCDET